MPLEHNRPVKNRKKDGKAHKNKNQQDIRLCKLQAKGLIDGSLIEELFDHLNVDVRNLVPDEQEYYKAYYCPAENIIYIDTTYLGSGWTGSPTEFMTIFEDWEEIDNSFIPLGIYVQFMEEHQGGLKGYNIYEVPKIRAYLKY